MMIGEIGGPQEAEAAAFARDHMRKPVVAYIAGLSAPKGRKMGHAGAIISAFGESAQEKVEILSAAGITVAPNPSAMGETMAARPASPRRRLTLPSQCETARRTSPAVSHCEPFINHGAVPSSPVLRCLHRRDTDAIPTCYRSRFSAVNQRLAPIRGPVRC